MAGGTKKTKNIWAYLFRWHRYSGLFAAIFVIMLSVTGILLNHTEELKLAKRSVASNWLMEAYGIEAPKITQAFSGNGQWVSQYGDRIYLGGEPLNCEPPLIGALFKDDIWILANSKQLCLFTKDAELIDSLSVAAENIIQGIGLGASDELAIRTRVGLYKTDSNYTVIEALENQNNGSSIKWKKSVQATEELQSSMHNMHRGEGLPWERVLLDLHSGRIIGILGVYFMDLIALLMIFLVLSGITLWAKRAIKRKKS